MFVLYSFAFSCFFVCFDAFYTGRATTVPVGKLRDSKSSGNYELPLKSQRALTSGKFSILPYFVSLFLDCH